MKKRSEQTESKRRGRPPKVMVEKSDQVITTTTGVVYSVLDSCTDTRYHIENIIQLKLNQNDIRTIEMELSLELNNAEGPIAYNTESCNEYIPEKRTSAIEGILKPAIKTVTVVNSPTEQERKDLIINSGIQRYTKPLMEIYTNGWPETSSYACWTCCHMFDTTPIGIPHMLVNQQFHCYGNFCSYNCAKRYLCPEEDDDIALLQTSTDRFITDDLSDKKQLLELLCHLETGLPFGACIEKSPKRLMLRMFGGNMSIEEYRANSITNKKYHVFRSPMVPISYQMEECITRDTKPGKTESSLSSLKLEKAYQNLLSQLQPGSNIIEKLLLK
jgi:hypothetical protein